jgi:NAD(P)-dependent dehydrogenase (short-subunit alcohol dehydrogenase family)
MQISTDTVALITGGSNGIGKECADRILRQGGRVVLVDYDSKAGQVTTREFSGKYGNDAVMFIHCDVSDNKQLDDAFTSAVKKFGRLDIGMYRVYMHVHTVYSLTLQYAAHCNCHCVA